MVMTRLIKNVWIYTQECRRPVVMTGGLIKNIFFLNLGYAKHVAIMYIINYGVHCK